MKKLIVDVRLVRKEGWKLPRFRSCMYRPVRGVLRLREDHADDLMRLCRVAELLDPVTGRPVEGVLPLYDAQLIAADGLSWTLTGFERVWDAGRLIDYAQTWLVDPAELTGE